MSRMVIAFAWIFMLSGVPVALAQTQSACFTLWMEWGFQPKRPYKNFCGPSALQQCQREEKNIANNTECRPGASVAPPSVNRFNSNGDCYKLQRYGGPGLLTVDVNEYCGADSKNRCERVASETNKGFNGMLGAPVHSCIKK